MGRSANFVGYDDIGGNLHHVQCFRLPEVFRWLDREEISPLSRRGRRAPPYRLTAKLSFHLNSRDIVCFENSIV